MRKFCLTGAGLLALAVGTAVHAAGQSSDFNLLDKDGNGRLTSQEISASGELSKTWRAADENNDGVIDRAEFQAFEKAHGMGARQAATSGRAGDAPDDRHTQADTKQGASAMSGQDGRDKTNIRVEERPARVEVTKEAPEVVVKQEPPEVTIKQPPPVVKVEQPQPKVTIEEAEPKVTVKDQGKPQVEIEQEGRADVEIETAANEGRDGSAESDRESRRESSNMMAESDRESRREGAHTMARADGRSPLMELPVSDLEGRSVENLQGNDLGEVEAVVQGQRDDEIYVIVSIGGFLGIGDKEVALPLEELELRGEELVMTTNRSEDELKRATAEYREEDYRRLEGEQGLAELIGGGVQPEERLQASFSQLDKDGDGAISRSEAEESQTLSRNWQQADRNNDRRLDRAEFSAFEEKEAQQKY